MLLHANFMCSTSVEMVMQKLTKAGGFRCIAPCMRGFGYSSYNKEITGFSEIVDDLKEFVAFQIGDKK